MPHNFQANIKKSCANFSLFEILKKRIWNIFMKDEVSFNIESSFVDLEIYIRIVFRFNDL